MIGPQFNLDPTPIWDRGSKDKLTADRHDLWQTAVSTPVPHVVAQ